MEDLELDQDCRDQGTKNEMICCYAMQLFKNNRFYKLKINISNAKGYLLRFKVYSEVRLHRKKRKLKLSVDQSY